MAREEEIKEQSTKYMWKQRKSHFEGYDIEYAFRAGAQWADEHPKDNLVDINKVYKWLAEIHRVCDITDENGYRIELRDLKYSLEQAVKEE